MGHYCPECERVMQRNTSTGRVNFICYCGVKLKGTPADALIANFVLNAAQTTEMYRRLIKSAAFGRVNKQVMRDCPKCGLDYMTQIRVGKDEFVIWTCKCGYQTSRYEAPKKIAEARH